MRPFLVVGVGFVNTTLAAASVFVSCRIAEPASSLMANNASLQASLGVEPGDPFIGIGPDLPERGHSAFDEVTAVVRNGQLVQEVPFPIEALLKKIDALTTGQVAGALLPRGRSLQRQAAVPHQFKFPRAVFAVTAPPSLGAPLLRDRLYVGYVESSNQLEVISFNEDLGRYEFQLVRNYGPNLTPKVTYAPRELCLSCHQNQSPIFSVNPWAETSGGSRIVAEMIRAARDNADHYLGIPLSADGTAFALVARIDESVERANLLSVVNRLWIDGCGRTAKNGPHCRAEALGVALEMAVGICNEDRPFDSRFCPVTPRDAERAAGLQRLLHANWSSLWPTGMKIPSAKVASRSIENEIAGGPDTATAPEFSATALRKPASILRLEASDGSEDAERLAKGLRFLMLARTTDRDTLMDLAHGDVTRLEVALAKLAEETKEGRSKSLAPEPFNRKVILADLRRLLGDKAPGLSLTDGAHGAWWKPNVTTEFQAPPELQTERRHPVLELFVENCGRCHLRAVPWLGGEKGVATWENVSTMADRILQRLAWEEHTQSGEGMPPRNSLEYRFLEEHPEIRRSMRRAVELCRGKDLATCAPNLAAPYQDTKPRHPEGWDTLNKRP